MTGEGGQAILVLVPVGPDAVQFGERLPTKEMNRATCVGPGEIFLGHEMEFGGIGIVDAGEQKRIDRLVGLAGNDHEGMHRSTILFQNSCPRRVPCTHSRQMGG
ncbi:MAG: hypothetical protein E6R14_08480 [Thermomicrobiales bacterium]|nr:MAG: hypothetical protein E6R14_08480 [Thermomicrobiales bacterium]